jgi:hypothetical protein
VQNDDCERFPAPSSTPAKLAYAIAFGLLLTGH